MAFSLIRDAFAILGSSKCECLSFLGIKGAYHLTKVSENSKPYCGIFGSTGYAYQRMPMRLNATAVIWQLYINAILSSTPDRSQYSLIMGGLLLCSSKHSHLKYLDDLLETVLKRGLKISPRKCQLFRTELQNMGKDY